MKNNAFDPNKAVRDWFFRCLQADEVTAAEMARYEEMPADQLLAMSINWIRRKVPVKPYLVRISKELEADIASGKTPADLWQIIGDMKAGRDLSRYLSKGLQTFSQDPRTKTGKKKSLLRRQDLDLMLNQWGVHHLHVSAKPDAASNGQWVERTGDLLFVIFKLGMAYLIGLYPHKEWTNQDCIRRIYRNWPDDHLVLEMIGASADDTITDEDVRTLRKKATNSLIRDGDKTLMPFGGLMGNGYSMLTIRLVDHVFEMLESAISNEEFFAFIQKNMPIEAKHPSTWHFFLNDKRQFGLTDPRNQYGCELGVIT